MAFYGGAIINIIKPACILFICAMFAKIISNKFVNIYRDMIYLISLICLILWFICLFQPGLSALKSKSKLTNVFIFSYICMIAKLFHLHRKNGLHNHY